MPFLSVRTPALLAIVGILAFFASTATPPAYAQDPAPADAAAPLPANAAPAEATPAEPVPASDWQTRFDGWFGESVVKPLNKLLFFSVYSHEVPQATGDPVVAELPLIVLVLVLGGLFYTFRLNFVNVTLFWHSLRVTAGKYDDPDDVGEVSHFKALTAALSATIGLGNIAGVALAITLGGPGAVFWMWFAAFFGMSMQFASTVSAQLYRRILPDGRVLGGPMVYLEGGIKELFSNRGRFLKPAGFFFAKAVGVLFAMLTIGGAFGAGNMFQANQTVSIIMLEVFDGSQSPMLKFGLGVVLAFLTGIVMIGGIKRIGDVTDKLVPFMCIFYCGVCLIIICMNLDKAPGMFASIFQQAFNPDAMYGGFLGALVVGMRRAAFSNESGLGSASIAQATAKTKEPVQGGAVAMMGPFIDTIVVCTMTALAILITDAHVNAKGLQGVEITSVAFAQLGAFVPLALCVSVFTFAYSTMISWGYYGERAVEYLVGTRGILPYRILYVATVCVGPVLSLNQVMDFADGLLLSMAFPNILGMALFSGKIKSVTADYVRRLKGGKIAPTR